MFIADLPPVPRTSMVAKAPQSITRSYSQYPQERALLDPSWPTPGLPAPTFGVDVSNWEGLIDWPTVANPPAREGQIAPRKVQFAFAKATQGTYLDPFFPGNWQGMEAAGLIRGVYSFGDFTKKPRADAQYFVNYVNAAGGFRAAGDFAVLDAEGDTGKKKPKAVVTWMDRWTKEVQRLTGLPNKRMVIYTGSWWWAPKTGNTTKFAKKGYRLWASGYGAAPAIRGWKWSWWQYTDRAKVPGITGGTDANVWRGSDAKLRKAAGLPPAP